MGILGGTLSQLGGGFAQLGSVVSGFAAGGPAGAAIAGMGQIVQGLEWSVKVAGEAQTAWAGLQATLHLTGAAWDEQKLKIDALVSGLSKTTTFADHELVNALQRMATYGMNASQAMDALKAATELAAAKHIDLETAATEIGKAFEGNTTMLKRYGVELTSTKDANAALKNTVDELAGGLKNLGPEWGIIAEYAFNAGINITDTTGKMRSTKDVAKDMVTAFQEGKISEQEWADIQAQLGVTFDTTKMSATDFAAAIGQVNTQYGGTAVAAASTYEGAQKRLANAMEGMGEKIGSILLPALASMTEGLIPVVDWLTTGVSKVQDWIAAVSKMPEVKAATDALSSAFQGLGKWFDQVSKDAADILGPALHDLWSSFKDIGDALRPLLDAFGELWSAFTDGQGSGNILKDILHLIADDIRAIAFVIKEVAPYIKMLAEAFKAAADFIAPIITTIRETIGGFLSWLTKAFQDFYNFLVGGSLWTDLWNRVVSIAQGIGSTVGTIISALFSAWQTIFTVGMQTISTILTVGFQLAFTTVQGIVKTGTDLLKSIFQGFIDLVSSGQKSWDDLYASVVTNTALMKDTLKGFFDWLTPFWGGATTAFLATALTWLDILLGQMRTRLTDLHNVWQSTMSSMAGDAASYFGQIVTQISADVDRIIAKLNAAKAMVSTHSIWPDMLKEMLAQTQDYMGQIAETFSTSLGANIIPTIAAAGPQPGGVAAAVPAAPSIVATHDITLPIQVILDGQVIQTVMEKRLIDSLIRDARRSRRGTE
jgi:phage-related protein